MRALLLIPVLALGGCASLSNAFGPPAERPRPTVFPSSGKQPYASTVQYFGYLPSGASPDTAQGEEAAHSLYVWLPNATTELGVRVVSPVVGWTTRQEGDFADPGFDAHATDPTGFDPQVRLERCLHAMNPEDLQSRCEEWALLGENDDSQELPPQGEKGPRSNALLRVTSDPDEPLRALIRGLYRVSLWAGKAGTPAGTWWLQLGSAREASGIQLARSREELLQLVPQ